MQKTETVLKLNIFLLIGTSTMEPRKIYNCYRCFKTYKYKESLYKHIKYECGIEPQFQCTFCPYKSKQRTNIKRHTIFKHGMIKNPK